MNCAKAQSSKLKVQSSKKPNTKHQRNSKHQGPIVATGDGAGGERFGAWSLKLFWCLGPSDLEFPAAVLSHSRQQPSSFGFRLSEVFVKMFHHSRPSALCHDRIRRQVGAAGERQQLKMPSRPEQRFRELEAVPEVNIVIARSVDQHQRLFQFASISQQ